MDGAAFALPRIEKAELSGLKLGAVIIVLALGAFFALLDLTISNVLVPHIAGALGASASDGTWVITGYAMAEAITVPLTGWLSERFGGIRMFTLSICGFGMFSLFCGMAPSLNVLIICRIILGGFGGPMISLSQALLIRLVPERHASMALAVWGVTSILAPAVGPLIGGLIGDHWSWQWAFYFKAPLAFGVAFLAWRLLGADEAKTTKAPIDYVGLLLLIVWVGALQVMLGEGQDLDWFSSGLITTLFFLSVIGFAVFVIWEFTDKAPIVDLRIFKIRIFSVAMLVIALAYGVLFGIVVLVPLWLQTSLGYTALWAGYISAFMGLGSVLIVPFVPWMMTRMDPRLIISGGLLVGAAACGVYMGYNDQASFWQMMWPQLPLGAALILIMVPLMDMSVSSLPAQDTASGAGQFNFFRTLAAALSTAAVVAFWNDQITGDGASLASELQNPQALLKVAAANHVEAHQALSLLDLMVQEQSVMLATTHTFMILGAMMLATAAIVWLAPRPPKSAGGMKLGH